MDNEANILRARGQLDAAIELLQETERVFREMNDPEALLISLANQASLLGGIPERRPEGIRLADEALALATQHHYRQLLPQIQRIRHSILVQ